MASKLWPWICDVLLGVLTFELDIDNETREEQQLPVKPMVQVLLCSHTSITVSDSRHTVSAVLTPGAMDDLAGQQTINSNLKGALVSLLDFRLAYGIPSTGFQDGFYQRSNVEYSEGIFNTSVFEVFLVVSKVKIISDCLHRIGKPEPTMIHNLIGYWIEKYDYLPSEISDKLYELGKQPTCQNSEKSEYASDQDVWGDNFGSKIGFQVCDNEIKIEEQVASGPFKFSNKAAEFGIQLARQHPREPGEKQFLVLNKAVGRVRWIDTRLFRKRLSHDIEVFMGQEGTPLPLLMCIRKRMGSYGHLTSEELSELDISVNISNGLGDVRSIPLKFIHAALAQLRAPYKLEEPFYCTMESTAVKEEPIDIHCRKRKKPQLVVGSEEWVEEFWDKEAKKRHEKLDDFAALY